MKELNIPASIPPPEVDRTAFIKEFKENDNWRYIESLLPHLEKLEDLGLVAQTVAIRKTGSKVSVLMELVNGFELASIPEEYEDYRFSIDLAKKTAALFQGFFESGYYHEDSHSGNIMYDQKRGKCVAVDLDSVAVKGNDTSLKDYVQDYSKLMLGVYLGTSALDALEDLLLKGGLQLSPITLVSKLMQEKGIYSKLHPAVREFVLRGLNPSTAPENFDEILALDPEAPQRM
jgi:hypothetical protein